MKFKRVDWIDILKCITMFLVILGHALTVDGAGSVRFTIYSFHMPLFFMISGMGLHIQLNRRSYNFSEFFKTKVKTILVPYFILMFFFALPIWVIIRVLCGLEIRIIQRIHGIIFANGRVIPSPSNPMWFLPTLFLTLIAFFGLLSFNKNEKEVNTRSLILSVLVVASFGYTASTITPKIVLPWTANTVPIALVFLLGGYLFIEHLVEIRDFLGSRKKQLIICLLLLPVSFYFATNNDRISLYNSSFGRFYPTMIAAFGFSFVMIIVSMNIPKLKILKFIGRNTLIYLVFHPLLFSFLRNYHPYTKALLNNYPYIISISTMLVLTPIAFIFEKYLPFCIGNYKKRGKAS